MNWLKGLSYFLLTVLGIAYFADARSCTIPRGSQYGRSVYLPRYGSIVNRYPQGGRIRHGANIVVACKKNINHDSVSRCQNGRWLPALPNCIVHRRCRTPPALPHATASEAMSPHITFPHGTTVTYTCDEGKMASGSNSVICDDGKWTTSNFQCLSHGIEKDTSQRSEKDCIIPSGARYRRTKYRPQSGSTTSNYPAGSVISHGNTIVVICKKDIYGDVVMNWSLSRCQSGEWIPKLPSCKALRRCRAPPSVQYATTSERITSYRTFPHGASVTYICDEGKMATGSDKVVCTDGQWSDTNFRCKDIPDTTTVQPDRCSQLTVKHGKISVKDEAYRVTCNTGFRLKSTKYNACKGGNWIGDKPECVRAAAQCRVSHTARRRSMLTTKATGKVINAMYIDHWTQVIQTCKGKSKRAERRTTKCVNGRWRPRLMSCRHSIIEIHGRNTGNRRQRSISECVIPNMRGGNALYHDVISGVLDRFNTGDIIQHGQKVQRECMEGFMILPVVQVNTTMITECNNGEWRPSIQRCLRDEKDTVFYDHLTDATTTPTSTVASSTVKTTSTAMSSTVQTTSTAPSSTVQTTSTAMSSTVQTTSTAPSSTVQTTSTVVSSTQTTTVTTTQEPDILYIIRINDNGGRTPLHVILDGTVRSDVNFTLDEPDSRVDNLRQYDKPESDVGEITKIQVSYTSEYSDPGDSSTASLTFVSIYKAENDAGGFYIEKYNRASPAAFRGRPCKRYFEDYPMMRPDSSEWDGNHETYQYVADSTICKFKCVEEVIFSCKAIYYSSKYKECTVFENDVIRTGGVSHLSISRRIDDC